MKIYQIYYDKSSEQLLDNSFIPFDNSKAIHSEWYEYSAIREIFKNNTFAPQEYVGVLSPKFFSKTGLSGKEVIRCVEKSTADIISFSPHFSQIALFKNPFTQGDHYHKGLLDTSQKLFNLIGLNINLEHLVTDQTRAIYSHYFIAKHSFWLEYLKFSEKIFDITLGNSEVAFELNSNVNYKNKNVQLKVFIMERLVSALLENLNINAQIGYSYKNYSKRHSNNAVFTEFLIIDSFKTLFLKTKRSYYMDLYLKNSQRVVSRLNSNKKQ